jgi:uncharacterized membrane protein
MDTLLYGFLQSIGYSHPLHPVLTHLVIGPVIAAFVISALGWLFKKPQWQTTARHLTVFALVCWFFTVGIGLIDWMHKYHGALVREIQIKLIVAAVLLVLLIVTIIINNRASQQSGLGTFQMAIVVLWSVGVVRGRVGLFWSRIGLWIR